MPVYTKDFLNDREPVYLQIIKKIKSDIVAKNLKNGDPLPSRRELAVSLEINPNTVQKAYKILEDEGILVTEHNSKSLVSVNAPKLEKIKNELAYESVKIFSNAMREMNMDKDDAIALLNEIWGDEK